MRSGDLLAREQPERIIVGEPLLMSGERGAQARAAAGFADRVRGRFGLPVELVDERLSTREAARRLAEAGNRRGQADLDSAAACVLLESVVGRARRLDPLVSTRAQRPPRRRRARASGGSSCS